MSKALGKRCVWGLCGVLASIAVVVSPSVAEVSTDMSGTIVVYPKVISNTDTDTIIQLTNTSNLPVFAWCFYVNAEPQNPNLPVSAQNPRRWQVTDFHVSLSRQQPTHWVASQGRFVDPTDGFGNDGSGLDPGAIPPVPSGFEGELRCVQVDANGTPFGGNALKGEATLLDRPTDGIDASTYNATSILATGLISGDNVIRLDNTPVGNDGEANSCYSTVFLNHFTGGVTDPTVSVLNPALCAGGGGCPINTELTMVPCNADFENIVSSPVTVQFVVTNEFEERFDASTTVQCWFNERLIDIGSSTGNGPFAAATLGSTVAFTSITPVGSDGGIIALAEESHSGNLVGGSAAWNLQAEGDFVSGRFLPKTRFDVTNQAGQAVVDTIVLPQGF